MKQDEYKDDEKVVYKTKAKLSLPHKESQEADCFVTEGHVVIEAEEQIKIPVSRIKDCNIQSPPTSILYSTPPQKLLPDTVTLTFLDDQNKKYKLLLEIATGDPSFSSYYFKEAIDKQIAKHKEPGVLDRFFDKVEERFRDKTRDNICAGLQSMGIDAEIAERGRAEEAIGIGFGIGRSESLGLIDISQGPIRWINVIKKTVGGPGGDSVTYYMKYGVPDSRLGPDSPQPRIKLIRKKSFPLFGQVTDLYWKGKDSGLGIISRLNSDYELKHLIMKSRDVEIYYDGWHMCWIISTKTGDISKVPSGELWSCYQAVARHLLAE